jgi:hypothetical protein
MPLAINERAIAPTEVSEVQFIQFYAPSADGTIIELEMSPENPLVIRVIEQRPGLPENLLLVPLPKSFIHRPDYLSNTTQVKYEIKL